MKWYCIYSGDKNFVVLDFVCGTHETAWNEADIIASNLSHVIEHYDVLGGFDSKIEMQEEIVKLVNQ